MKPNDIVSVEGAQGEAVLLTLIGTTTAIVGYRKNSDDPESPIVSTIQCDLSKLTLIREGAVAVQSEATQGCEDCG